MEKRYPNKRRLGKDNGRYKGVPIEAIIFFDSGFKNGLSSRTLSYQWQAMRGEKIDHRRIKRWHEKFKEVIN